VTSSDWATVVYSYTFVFGAACSVIWVIAKKAIHHLIDESQADIKTIKHEVTPNSGGSLNDKINKEIIPMLTTLVEKQQDIALDVATLSGKFYQHIIEHE
jgi:hypothetical protein